MTSTKSTGQPLRFWKMSGAGNDFVVLPVAPETLEEGASDFARRVCRRGTSVGADGVLFVSPAPGSAANRKDRVSEARLVHYNADGGRSDFCGNGSRCAARFAVLMGFATSPVLLVTDAGRFRAEIEGDRVRIEAPAPTKPVRKSFVVEGREYAGWFTLAGVPHLVVPVENLDAVDVARVGSALRSHPDLGAAGANVDFLAVEAREGKYRVRTFERGVEAETLACGSGALASAAVLGREGAASPVLLTPRSGIDLNVEFESQGSGLGAFHLTGEARVVFEGLLASMQDTSRGRRD